MSKERMLDATVFHVGANMEERSLESTWPLLRAMRVMLVHCGYPTLALLFAILPILDLSIHERYRVSATVSCQGP